MSKAQDSEKIFQSLKEITAGRNIEILTAKAPRPMRGAFVPESNVIIIDYLTILDTRGAT